jgi:hypothetical protein
VVFLEPEHPEVSVALETWKLSISQVSKRFKLAIAQTPWIPSERMLRQLEEFTRAERGEVERESHGVMQAATQRRTKNGKSDIYGANERSRINGRRRRSSGVKPQSANKRR